MPQSNKEIAWEALLFIVFVTGVLSWCLAGWILVGGGD